MKNLSKCCEKYGNVTMTILRVVIGAIFIAHGYQKFLAPAMAIGMTKGIGFPFPEFFGWALILSELIGGILILVGFLTRFVTPFLIFSMLVALFTVHLSKGFITPGGYEYVLLLIASLLVLQANGAKLLSLDKLIFKGKV